MKSIFFFIFLIIQQANCKQFFYAPSIETPIHLQDLYSSVQKLKDFDFAKNINRIDFYHQKIPLSVLEKLTLSEISKFLIKHRPHYESLKFEINQKSINSNLDDAVAHESVSLFGKWFLKSLRQDFDSLFNSNEINTYLSRKKAKRKMNSIGLRKLNKKFSILLSWYSLLKFNGPLIFNNEINKILPSLMHAPFRAQEIFITLTQIKTNKKNSSLKYFKKINMADIEMEKRKMKVNEFEKFLNSLPAIIKDPIQGIEIPVQIPTPINDWVPKDDLNPTILFPAKDPKYNPPENLPEPVNDWLMDA